MSAKGALKAVHAARGARDVIVTTMSPARDWMMLPQQPLDLVFVPSAMGHATSVGLGLALAQPDRRVVVCNGDGSMLMNLGSLASIAAASAVNLIVLIFVNGIYEVTGAQPIPNGATSLDFTLVARGCGIRSTFRFANDADWERDVASVLAAPGPTVVQLDVEAVVGIPGPRSPGPARARAQRFMSALATRDSGR
jgi:phosphonopyruvate decarboxylase